MSMLNEVDCSPDTPVVDAAAERMALKEMEHEKFRDTNEMSGFQRGYSRGFLEGAEFIRAFYRKRDMRDHLQHMERERKKREAEQKKGVSDDRLLQPVDDALKKVEQESFLANYAYEQSNFTPPEGDRPPPPFEKLCRQVEFDQSEIQQVREMVTGMFPDASEKHCEKDNRSRDDYLFGLGNGRAVWVNKSKPLFSDDGMYNILCCGDVTTMSPQNFHTLDDLLRRLKSRLENLS